MSKGVESTENGRISVLVLALVLLVVAVITVALVVTSLHTQRRALYGCADVLALSAAQILGADPYFQEAATGAEENRVKTHVEQRLQELRSSTCDVGEEVVLEEFKYTEGNAEITVATFPTFPRVAAYMSFLTEPLKIRVVSLVNVTKSRNV